MHIFDFFRDIFSVFGAFSRFLGVKFGFRKSCQCKRNDKYEVCSDLRRLPTSLFCDISWWVFIWYFFKRPPAQTSTYRTCYWHRSSESKITPSASLSLQRLLLFKLHWLGLLSLTPVLWPGDRRRGWKLNTLIIFFYDCTWMSQISFAN